MIKLLLALAALALITTPVSAQTLGPGSIGPFAYFDGGPTISITGPASTSAFSMMGIAASGSGCVCTITPTTTGKVQITITMSPNNGSNTTAGQGLVSEAIVGTGAAPANAASIPGGSTQVGPQPKILAGNTVAGSGGYAAVMTMQGVVVLAVGTTYWIDVAAECAAGCGYTPSRVHVSAVELP